MRRRHGFTLVELLVVIGIIALLISILLPALNKARWSASITKCAAQMRQISTAALMYANDNRGSLPPFRFQTGDINSSPDLAALFVYEYQNSNVANIAFDDPREDGAQLGRLVKRKYLTVGVLRCPNAPDPITTGNINSVQNYMFNPHLAQRTLAAGGTRGDFWWKKIKNYGKPPKGDVPVIYGGGNANSTVNKAFPQYQRALVAEPTFDLSTASHANGNKRAYNFAYPDGSVQTAIITAAIDRSSSNGTWPRFLDTSNLLQAYVAGQFQIDNAKLKSGGYWNTQFNMVPVDPN